MKEKCSLVQLYKKHSKREKCVFFAVLVLVFSIFQLAIKQICGFTIYPDEFGYWASAANMLGWDWTEIASLGSYYSFGYSLLLYPILCFTSNSIVAYQTAVFLNVIFMCMGYVLLCAISERLFGDMPRIIRYLVAGAAVLYPAWIFYMQTTMAEALIIALFVLVVFCFIEFMEKPNVLKGMALVLVLVYFYVVHMRTIGTIVACLLTFLLWGISKPHIRKYVLYILTLTIAAFIGAFYIKELVQESVYVSVTAEKLAVNDYAGKLKSIMYIFTPEGFGSFVSHMAGKIVYWGVASLGLVYWAFSWMASQITGLIKKVKNRQEIIISEWVAIFLFLATLSQIVISSVFYIHGRDLDVYMNGRYIDFLVPVFLIMGFYHLYTSINRWKKTICFSVVHIVLTILTASTIWMKETQRIRGYFQVGINWMLSDATVDTQLHLIKVAFAGVVFLFFVALLMRYIKKREIFTWFFSIFMFVEILIALLISIQFIYHTSNLCYRECVLIDIIEEQFSSDEDIYYLEDGSLQWIDFIQMQLRERSMKVVTKEEWEQGKDEIDILFTANNEKNKEKYSSQFDKCVSESLLILFYNTEDGGNTK